MKSTARITRILALDAFARSAQSRTVWRTRDWAANLALIALCLIAFLPGFVSLPPMDRDEPRFAQASKQMLETGDFINIRLQNEARLKKPVGIYWLQVASVSAARALGAYDAALTTIALYRVPSLLAAIAAVLMTRWTALPLFGARVGFLAGAIMAATILLGVEARLATTDAVLMASVLAMMGALGRMAPLSPVAGQGRLASVEASTPAASPLALPALFWTAAAVSILIKGPVGPMVVALAIVALMIATRQVRWMSKLRPLPGLAWTVLLVAPWLIAIMIATHGRFFQESVGQDMMSKVAGGQESHGAPPGTYLAAVWLTFWPAAPLAALATPWVWRNRRSNAVLFVLCWLAPSWLVFEAVPTKLPHYVLPLYPALAILVAAAVEADGLSRAMWARAVALLVPVLAVATPLAGLGAIWFYEHQIAWALLPFVGLAGVAGVLAWRRLPGRPVEGLAWSVAASLLVTSGIYGIGIPRLPTLWPSPRLAEVARTMDCPNPAFAAAGDHEPSLVFLVGTGLQLPDDGKEAADFLASGGCRMAFVSTRMVPAFQAQLSALGRSATLVTRVSGVNLNGGRRLDMAAYRAEP